MPSRTPIHAKEVSSIVDTLQFGQEPISPFGVLLTRVNDVCLNNVTTTLLARSERQDLEYVAYSSRQEIFLTEVINLSIFLRDLAKNPKSFYFLSNEFDLRDASHSLTIMRSNPLDTPNTSIETIRLYFPQQLSNAEQIIRIIPRNISYDPADNMLISTGESKGLTIEQSRKKPGQERFVLSYYRPREGSRRDLPIDNPIKSVSAGKIDLDLFAGLHAELADIHQKIWQRAA